MINISNNRVCIDMIPVIEWLTIEFLFSVIFFTDQIYKRTWFKIDDLIAVNKYLDVIWSIDHANWLTAWLSLQLNVFNLMSQAYIFVLFFFPGKLQKIPSPTLLYSPSLLLYPSLLVITDTTEFASWRAESVHQLHKVNTRGLKPSWGGGDKIPLKIKQ